MRITNGSVRHSKDQCNDLTERKAWMRSALICASALPFTMMVYVSSFSVDMRLPNHERFVSSGEDSGVGLTSSATVNENDYILTG